MLYKRVIVTEYGGPETLREIEEECPEPQPGEARVRMLTAGVALPDIMMREGFHPETPRVPFTPGWDLVGVVDQLGRGVSGAHIGQRVAALPISGGYSQFICLPERDLAPVPPDVNEAEAVCLILNYITAYQMLHRSAKARPGQRALIHGASGGVGSALLQLGRLAGLEMFGTCSARNADAVSKLGAAPIDYQKVDFVSEIHRQTKDGVDIVFDGMGGPHMWRSRKALKAGGKVVVYGLTAAIREGTFARGRRRRFHGMPLFLKYILGGLVLPEKKRVIPYSIQWLKRFKPAYFREDLIELFSLLREEKIIPLIAKRFPLSEARQAQEMLSKGGVTGKIVLESN